MYQGSVYEYRSKLSIFEEEASIFVKGSTFRYGFDKKSGLINRLEVLGDDFLSGTESYIPDIYVSNARAPHENLYAAKYEDEAECDIISANPYEIHIRTHGIYHSSSGEVFPVRYRITYEIQSDGTIFVIVHNKAHKHCVIRWLCISRGILNPSLCKYFSHLADQSKTDTTDNYTFKDLPSGATKDQVLFSGRLIPWFWLGNDRTGVEICVWDVSHHRYGATQVSGKMMDPLGEVGANISCVRQASGTHSGILWEIFSLRNLQTPVKEGWEQINYFTLSVTPSRVYGSRFADVRAYWAESRQYDNDYKYLSDDEIRNLSRMGYNLIIGGINWRYGEFVPDNEAEVRRVIAICHKYGIKIIPCIPIMDLNEDTAIFEEHGPEWRIEPVVEREYETNLMCPGAEEWREHWKQQIDRISRDYDFDGAYLDLWYDKLACRNPQHGCQKRYMRPIFPWVREMLGYASAKFKGKNTNSVIITNTDLLPISMICSWLDARLVGASQDVRHINRMTGKAFYSSYRLGCDSLMQPTRIPKIDLQVISLSLLYMAPIILDQGRSQEEMELTLLYLNTFRFFGTDEAVWYPGFIDDPKTRVATTSNPDLYINVHKSNALLLTLANLSPNEVAANVSLSNSAELGLRNDRNYLIYDPISRKFLSNLHVHRENWSCDDMKAIPVTVSGHNPRILYVRECPESPILLFATGSDKVLDELWDKDHKILSFQLSAPPGADVSLAIYSPIGKPARIISEGKEILFAWDEGQRLAFSDIQASDVECVIEARYDLIR